ncbi:MAG: cell division protein FtsA, partial [Lachnospiraceae bacterium]|nr:cell division protein FtsA [Lachnospiraceae bacterium]
GKIEGYAEAIAKYMELPEERVALRGEEVMRDIIFMSNDGIERDSRMVTPLGICMSYYASNNNFVFVNFNGEQVKLYDNGKLSIGDVAMQVDFPNEDLFPKRGKDLVFTINGKERIIRGKPGESAEILLNGQPADIHALLHGNDIIEVRRSTTGPAAKMDIEALPEFKANFRVNVNGQDVEASRVASVNGRMQTGFYGIHSGDDVRILDYDTAEQIAALLDIEITPDTVIIVNNELATRDTPVYENFKVEFKRPEEAIMDYYHDFPDQEEEEGYEPQYGGTVPPPPVYEPDTRAVHEAISSRHVAPDDGQVNMFDAYTKLQQAAVEAGVIDGMPVEEEPEEILVEPVDLHVEVNGTEITMTGKSEYIFVDVFDYIDFDLKMSKGRAIVTQVNGASPDYMQVLAEGDKIEIYWKEY